jgi:hypothetical protein
MWKDPIVEETRKRRDQYAASLPQDLDAIFLDIQERQANRPLKAVTLPARKPGRDSHAA